MAPYGSMASNSGNKYSSAYKPMTVNATIQGLTPGSYLRGMRIMDVRHQGAIVQVTDYNGNKYFVDRRDFEYLEQSGELYHDREMYRAKVMGDFTSYAYGEAGQTLMQQAPITNPAKPKSPEKNSLKKVYYHNRLRKKS